MAQIVAITPVNLGGRFQQVAATSVFAITLSDTVPQGPIAQLVVTTAGNLVLGMWDGTTVTLAVVVGEVLQVSPKLIKAATTAVVFGMF